MDQCGPGWLSSQNLRLPSNGEALLVTKAVGGETWTDDVITPSAAGEAGRVQGGVVFSTPLAQSHSYRCVSIPVDLDQA